MQEELCLQNTQPLHQIFAYLSIMMIQAIGTHV